MDDVLEASESEFLNWLRPLPFIREEFECDVMLQDFRLVMVK